MNQPRKRIQSVDRALDILELLAQHDGLGLSELSRQVGLNKTTVYRFLATLHDRGFVRQSPETSKYSLGWKVVELSGWLLEGAELVAAANVPLKRLSEDTREAVHLGVLDEGEVVYVSKIDSVRPIRIASRIGARVPAHCTALGKCLLAYMPAEEAAAVLTRHPPVARTSHTRTRPEDVLASLDEVRRDGYSLDLLENEEGIICIGAPAFDNSGALVAAVSISGPDFRFADEAVATTAPLVQRCARDISANLGFPVESYGPRLRGERHAPAVGLLHRGRQREEVPA